MSKARWFAIGFFSAAAIAQFLLGNWLFVGMNLAIVATYFLIEGNQSAQHCPLCQPIIRHEHPARLNSIICQRCRSLPNFDEAYDQVARGVNQIKKAVGAI